MRRIAIFIVTGGGRGAENPVKVEIMSKHNEKLQRDARHGAAR
jgi:hypothetical protein